DFVAYLKLFLNPHDDASLLRIANVPARGLSDLTLERLLAASQERRCSVYAAMNDGGVQASFVPKTPESSHQFIPCTESTGGRLACEASSLSLRGWAEQFLEEICYVQELRRSEKSAETGENRARNLMELVSALDRPESQGQPPTERLQGFLEELMLD